MAAPRSIKIKLKKERTMTTLLTIDDLRQQYGSSENRNRADITGTESVLKPFTEGTADVNITQGGQILGSNSSEMDQIRQIDPNISNKLQTAKDLQGSFGILFIGKPSHCDGFFYLFFLGFSIFFFYESLINDSIIGIIKSYGKK
ncbi:MAG: hypothetical protein PHS92_03340 [Candidatus Gracilibacteria bacterium]|nr:hypothetical protein [Candidatus Gracilibacteria bacterium]